MKLCKCRPDEEGWFPRRYVKDGEIYCRRCGKTVEDNSLIARFAKFQSENPDAWRDIAYAAWVDDPPDTP